MLKLFYSIGASSTISFVIQYENPKIYIWYAYLFNFCFKAPLFSVACDVWICGGGAPSESICETFCIIYTTRELISRDLAKGRVVGEQQL